MEVIQVLSMSGKSSDFRNIVERINLLRQCQLNIFPQCNPSPKESQLWDMPKSKFYIFFNFSFFFNFSIENQGNNSVPQGVLHSFSVINIFYDKMDLRLFYFHVTIHKYNIHLFFCKKLLVIDSFIKPLLVEKKFLFQMANISITCVFINIFTLLR